jgi:hypothetical protein
MTHQQESKQELFWAEWFQEDRLDKVMWAAAFIWAGLVILGNNLGYLDGDGWSLFFRGAGLLLLVELAVRLLVPSHRRDLLGTLFLAGFLLWLGDWALLWPLILIGIGGSILIHHFFRGEEQNSAFC